MAACHIHLTPVESCPYCTGPYLPVSEVNVLEAVKPIAGGSSACPADYLVQQIEKTGAPTDPCCPQAAAKTCTLKGDKFFDLLVAPFYIPPVGLSNPMVVCEGDYWKIGMWLYADGGGKFEITNVVDDTLTVRNGCSNGASIPNNQAPGKQILTGSLVYPVGPAECPLDALEGEDICLTHVPDSEANELTHLFGGSLEEISFEVDEDVVVKKASCLRKLANLFSNGKSLLMALMDGTDLAPVSVDGSDQYKEMVVWDPVAGELKRLIAEPCATFGTNHNGKMVNILGGNYNYAVDGPAHPVVWLSGANKCGLRKLPPPTGSDKVIEVDSETGEVRYRSSVSTLLSAPVVVGQHRTGYTAGPATSGVIDFPSDAPPYNGSFDMTTIGTYPPGAKAALIRGVTSVNVVAGATEALAQVKVNGILIVESWMYTVGDFGYKNDTWAEVELTNDAFAFDLIAYSPSPSGQAWSKLQVMGWRA